MKHALVAAGLAFIAVLMTPSQAETCSCAPLKPPAEAAAQAGLVFSGKVVEILRKAPGKDFGPRHIRFEVRDTFRGKPEPDVTLFSNGGGSAACDFDFQVGREYLIYAFRSSPEAPWSTSTCSRTRPLNMAGEDLRALHSKDKD